MVATTSRKLTLSREELVKLRLLTGSFRCICGAEFCYICGVKWKTCNCGEIGEQPQMAQDEELRDREADHWMNYALANVQDMHEDGRIEWREVLAAAAALE